MALPHALALRTVIGAIVVSVATGTSAAADATWKTHRDDNCGIELKYPGTYSLEASGATDSCALWIRIGLKQHRGLGALFSLETREMETSIRPPLSPRDFALQVAAAQCMADGPDGSTYCTDVGIRSTFKTAQAFQAFEIRLTEVRETVSPAKTEKRKRDPVFALDLSDDETVRVLMAAAEPAHLAEIRATSIP